MRSCLILLSAICLALAGAANGSVKKGEIELEVFGGLSIENGAAQGDDQDSILAGAAGADLDGWFASAGIGCFFSNNFQLGVAGFGSWLSGSETARLVPEPAFPTAVAVYDVDIDAVVYGVGGRAKWHFAPKKSMVPYVGVQVFWATADIDVSGTAEIVIDGEGTGPSDIDESDSDNGILWGPIVGVRLQLGERDEVFFEYQYHLWSGSIGDILDDGHAISLGLAHRLK